MSTHNRKKTLDIITTVNIIFAIANLVFALFNAYFVSSTYSINSANMGLQSKLYDFNSTIIINPNPIFFGYPTGWSSSGKTITEINYDGSLESTIQVITPHYGKIEVSLMTFEVADSKYLSIDSGNRSSVRIWNDESYYYLVNQGINSIDMKIQLAATVYPNPATIQEDVQFLLGLAHFEANLTDLQSQQVTKTIEFSERVFVSLPPQS